MAFQVQPPQSNHILALQQAWYRLGVSLDEKFEDTGISNVLFVDAVDGNDSTAVRGSITYSYSTIQAALDAAQEGDTVYVGPGEYGSAVWPDTNNVTLQGFGQSTKLTSAAATATLTIAPTDDVVTFVSIKDVFIENTGGAESISIDGTNCPGLGNDDVLSIKNCLLVTSGAVNMTASICDNLELFDISSADNSLVLSQTGRVLINSSQFGDISTDNDPAVATPTGGFGRVIVTTSLLNDVQVDNVGVFVATDDTQLNNLTVNVVDDAAGAFGNAMVSGRILGDIDADFDFDDAVPNKIFLILDGARISGTLNVAAVAPGLGDGGYCRALNAVFYDTSASAITADSEAIIDVRGSQFAQAALNSDDTLTTTPGVIDRTHWYETIAAGEDIGAGFVVTFGGASPIPFPASAADAYTVITEAANQLDAADGMGISAKLAASVTITGANGGGVGASAGDVRVHVIREFD